ncbi:hypothetical protein BKP37_15180 [Anaerobacillus alkalilacustris]|uniref:DUF1934 domain-containing protein n=1 Tax=Anaerobacillus alkalilacustris TaxID=393763 RepID=A0A1S2LHS6_9BACI|nr:DUF1934 domain-containing protein [Anaerobacillus alkalilacustris]OIJ11780.1 hypothetical protein BKP37_15180 [Anaerobacillus alkalilacustris]
MNQEGNSVTIEMKTDITDGDQKHSSNFQAEGKLFRKNNSLYLQFKEDNKEIGAVNQVVKIDNQQSVTVLRQGAVSMKQQFLIREKTEGVYRSQFGPMLMDTYTKHIKLEIDEQQAIGTVQLSYQLHMQHEFAGDYEVTINFRRSNR